MQDEYAANAAQLPADLERIAGELARDPEALRALALRLRDGVSGTRPIIALCTDDTDDVTALTEAALAARGYTRELFRAANGLIIVTHAGDEDPAEVAAWKAADDAYRAARPADAPAHQPAPADAAADDMATPAGFLMHEQLVSIHAAAKRRGLRVVITNRAEGGADATVMNQRNATLHSGTVAEVFKAMHSSDNVLSLPVPPTETERLSERIKPHGWSCKDNGAGRYTLLRGEQPIYSGTLDDVTTFAEQKILNLGTHPVWGLTLDNVMQGID